MQEDKDTSIQQMREGLHEVEERFEQWKQNYMDYLYQVEKLRALLAHLHHIMQTQIEYKQIDQ